MDKYKPDASSLGLRVKDLILEDLSYCAALVCNRKIANPDYRKQLINASSLTIFSAWKRYSYHQTKRNGTDLISDPLLFFLSYQSLKAII